jgi:Mrp family chromosome partitioning ATPase
VADEAAAGTTRVGTPNGNGNGNGAPNGNGHVNGNGHGNGNGHTADDAAPDPLSASTPADGGAGASSAGDEAASVPAGESSRGQVILITSPGPSEGKTTTAANLAGAIAETGYRVLIVNCDFRRPRLADFFDRRPGPGEVVGTDVSGVDILNEVIEADHDVSPALVLAAQRRAIHTHVQNYDVVLLDTAPMLTTNDALDVLIEADAVIVVGRSGKTPREAADRAAEALERRNAPVIGVVLVGASESPTSRYYYYGGKGEGYYTDGRRRSSAPPAAGEDLAPTATV